MLQDLAPKRLVERLHLDAQTTGEPRADALFERLEVGGRPVRGHDDLATVVDQRVERVAELRLDRLSLQELHVVDDQNVDGAQLFLEGDRGLGLQGRHEAVHEALGREVDDPPSGLGDGMGRRLQQVCLAEPDGGMDVERTVEGRIAGRRLGDALRRETRELVRLSDHEAGKRQAPVERRTRQSIRRDRRGFGLTVDAGHGGAALRLRRRARLRGPLPASTGCTVFGARREELLSPMTQRFTSGASAAKVAQSLST